MSRIDELIAELCPGGVEYKSIGDFGELVRGNGMPKSDFVESGVGCIHYGQIYTYYGICTTETKSFISAEKAKKLAKVDPGDLVITNTSENIEDVCKAVAWLGDAQIVTGGHATVLKHNQDAKYLSYYLQTPRFFAEKKKHATGTKVIDVSAKSLAKICIPIPPLEIQREIVKVLDTFTQLEAELEAELEARQRQYQYYRDALLSFDGRDDVRWATLGGIGKVSMCKRIFKNETSNNGEIPFYKIGTFGGSPDAFISREIYEQYRSRYSFPKKGDVLISAAGTIGRAIPYDGEDAYFQDSNIVWIANDESLVTNKYLWHWYQIVEWTTDGGTIQRLYNENLRQTKIAIPPLEEQERIVAILDKFDALVNDLGSGLPAEIKARRQQYEHYRDRLLSFKEAA